MNENSKGILYLIPSSLGADEVGKIWPESNVAIVHALNHFIVENIRSARRFLQRTGYQKPFEEVVFGVLNKHTTNDEIATLMQPLFDGISVGILSEAGCPGVADPGQEIVSRAHQLSISVKPLVGPNSIVMALMASGMNGQSFCFHGYLPIKAPVRIKRIKDLVKKSEKTGATQIFMETPFRNNALLKDILMHCNATILLGIAADLTMETEYVVTRPIGTWRETGIPDLHKRPAIFLLSV